MSQAHNIYDFSVPTSTGEEQALSDYQGKVVLIVNTASKCGFTPQYEGLQTLHDTYAERGLVIICLLYTSPSPRDQRGSRMPSSA